MNPIPRDELRPLVRGIYDLQKMRIQAGNRLVANFKKKLGIDITKKEDLADSKAKEIMKQMRAAYNRIADAIGDNPTIRQFTGNEAGIIDRYTDFILSAQYMRLLDAEERQFKMLAHVVEQFPVWSEYLKDVKGCGPAMAAVLLSEIDIKKAHYPAYIWAYAGLDVAPDGRGRGKHPEHLVKRKYIAKDGTEKERDSITFNPFLKTKLVGVLAGSFLRAKDNPYATIYYDYKHRLENHPKHKEKTPGHRHNMAKRYMIKRFLADLYVAWRSIEGLSVAPEYTESKLDMHHHGK